MEEAGGAVITSLFPWARNLLSPIAPKAGGMAPKVAVGAVEVAPKVDLGAIDPAALGMAPKVWAWVEALEA